VEFFDSNTTLHTDKLSALKGGGGGDGRGEGSPQGGPRQNQPFQPSSQQREVGRRRPQDQAGKFWSCLFKPLLPITPTQKDKEDLEEISSELELADEDEKVPYVP
jgi:hypothetical protein